MLHVADYLVFGRLTEVPKRCRTAHLAQRVISRGCPPGLLPATAVRCAAWHCSLPSGFRARVCITRLLTRGGQMAGYLALVGAGWQWHNRL